MKNIFLLAIGMLMSFILPAQELEVNVTINTPKLQTADPKVFETLETAIEELMNSQKWTDEVFEQEERIKMDIVLTISKELSANTFEAELSFQSTRPVYGSTYSSPMVKHNDKDVTFSYEQFQPLEFSETSYTQELTAVLGFYAYVVLGMDFDSFSPYGGEPYFQQAWDIVQRIPPNVAASVQGWKATDGDRTRYKLAENLTSPRVRPLRSAMYDYHRQGLDFMHEDAPAGLAVMTQAIENLQMVNKDLPNSMIMQVFANTKQDEIIEIYKGAAPQEKDKVVRVMARLDPSKASSYRQGIGK